MALLSFLSGLLLLAPPAEAAPSGSDGSVPARPTAPACEDFAKRQIGLADRLTRQSNYSRALKVLNSTAKNCDRDFVREKLYEVLGEWYGTIRGRGVGALREFLGVVDNQSYLTSSQRARLVGQVRSDVRSMIDRTFEGGEYEATRELCRTFPDYVSGSFDSEYACGTAAEQVGAEAAAMASYSWLLENWAEEQAPTTWTELATTLESMYLLNGRFRAAYDLGRRRAARDPGPETILSTLISARGNFLAPLLRVGAVFYGNQPGDRALTHVDTEMQRVDFPDYVRAFYVLGPDGTVQRGMYGSQADAPSASLLEEVSGAVSLLRASSSPNLAWLVSPVGSRFLVLEFGVATTPEENVRLESIQENVESDQQWQKLYQLEYTETYPASGSAIGTLLGGATLAGEGFEGYGDVFDGSPVLTYYCIQSESGDIVRSHDFGRSRLGYGGDEWERTSSTPALYHHAIQYAGQSMREVVWPNFVNDEWTGVIRIGLVQS
jgi:hypothetical protein